jgi:adenylate cyclase class 2
MSYEVEVKYRVPSHGDLPDRLAAIGGVADSEVKQCDEYLAHPARDFAVTGEALRLRQTGPKAVITYKGPRLGGPTKTREEIEVAFAGGVDAYPDVRRVFQRLGFRSVAIVRKTRRPYHLSVQGHSIEVALDTVDGLGPFVEIEAIAGSEEQLPAVQRVVLELAGRFNLVDLEPRSYLRMILER